MKMNIELAKKIYVNAIEVADTAYRHPAIYAKAYESLGLNEEDFLPECVKESYWFRRLGRTVSPFCMIAVQNFLEYFGEGEVKRLDNTPGRCFTPCDYCPYKDKRRECDYACRPGFVPMGRFLHLSQTSMEELDECLRLTDRKGDAFYRDAQKMVEDIFQKEISDENIGKGFRESQLIVG